MPVFRYSSWIRETRAPIADQETGDQCVEQIRVSFSEGAGLYVIEKPLRGVGQKYNESRHCRWCEPLHGRQLHEVHVGSVVLVMET